MTAVVRLGRETDYPQLYAMGQRFADASPFKGTANAAQLRRVLVESSEDGLLLVAAVNDLVVGCLVGVTNTLWYDPDTLLAVELAWWIDPEFRKGTVGLRLWRGFETQARAAGCKFCTMMTLPLTDPTGRIATMYERQGYVLTEKSYMKELE